MADFSHLGQLEVSTDKTAKFVLHQITVNGLTPTLIVAPATEANKSYFNALLKRASKSARAIRAGTVNAGMLDESREEDRALYSKHVIKGWEDMVDGKTGKVTDFSVTECEAFLAQLPNWLFDEIRQFCGNPASFTELMDIEVSSKN